MTKNPIINALSALCYISAVAAVMSFAPRQMGPVESIIGPIAGISLFTLSAAVMGYIFCYQPLQLYFDGSKKEAVNLFLKTVGFFAVATIILLAMMFTGIFS